MKRKLRNVLLLCAGMIAMLGATELKAQEAPRVGFKGGLNLSNLYVDEANDENARFGWHAGFFTQLLSSEAFAIQPEINYSTKGTGVTYAYAGTLFKLGRAAEIHAGPYWSYLLRAEIKNNDGNPANEFDTIDRDNFDDWDYGLVGGIGFNLGKSAQLGARYNYGLNKIAESRGAKAILGNAKNQVAQIYVAFNLNGNDNDLDN
jgi:hypothetical protein